jgi:hypothetical protein
MINKTICTNGVLLVFMIIVQRMRHRIGQRHCGDREDKHLKGKTLEDSLNTYQDHARVQDIRRKNLK